MGKKRIAKKKGGGMDASLRSRALARVPRKKVATGILYVRSTYNNTAGTLTDPQGNVLVWSSSGALGFKGTRKGTPYAAAKVGEVIGEKANMMGMQTAQVVVKGVGAGRESLVRAFANKGIDPTAIKDTTPVPFNGPRAPKPRRV